MKLKTPDHWSNCLLGEATTVLVSSVDKKNKKDELPIKLCNYTDVYKNEYISSKLNFMSATAKQQEIDKYTLHVDDVIITKDSETPNDIAVPAVVKEKLGKVLCGYHLAILRPKKNVIIGEFLNKLIQLKYYQYYFFTLANGATRFGLGIDAIKNARVSFPSLEEQKRIVAVLSTWDQVIEKIEELIEAKKKQFKWLLKILISDKKWPMAQLKNLCEINPETANPKTRFKTGFFHYIDISSVVNGKARFKDQVNVNKAPSRARMIVRNNDVIISTVRPNLKAFALLKDTPDRIVASTGFAILRSKLNLDSDYLFLVINTNLVVKQMIAEMGKGVYPSINRYDVEKIKIPLPPIEEQKRITAILSKCQSEIDTLKKLLAKYQEQKKGLMQQLLTGKIRVPPTMPIKKEG